MKLSNGIIKLYITMKKVVKLPEPSGRAVGVDLNFNEIVVGNEKIEFRIKTPLARIMHIKHNHMERTQKKYSKKWLNVKGIRNAISRWWKRISGIIDNFVKQTSKIIVKLVKELGFNTIVLEDLNGLKYKQAKLKKTWRKRFTFFAYRKLQHWIE